MVAERVAFFPAHGDLIGLEVEHDGVVAQMFVVGIPVVGQKIPVRFVLSAQFSIRFTQLPIGTQFDPSVADRERSPDRGGVVQIIAPAIVFFQNPPPD